MDQKGSLWRKWDFHIHTPESFEWKGESFAKSSDVNYAEKNKKILSELISKIKSSDVSAFVIMDYWTFDGYLKLKQFIKQENIDIEGKVIFPGIELRIESPTEIRMNIHAILSNESSEQELSDFKGKLTIQNIEKPLSRSSIIEFARKLGSDKARLHGFDKDKVGRDDEHAFELGCRTVQITKSSFQDAFDLMNGKALAFIPWDTSDGLTEINWEEHPADVDYFMQLADIFETRNDQQIKLINGVETSKNKKYLNNFLHALDCDGKLAVSGSDAHRINDYGIFPNNRPTWLKCDLTFDGLKQSCIEPVERSFIGELPAKLNHYRLNPGKYVESVKISKIIPNNGLDKWFDVDISLNVGLISIIGNKGSGKSALADIIGFAANARVEEQHLSFLTPKRFKKDSGKLASKFHAELKFNQSDSLKPVSLNSEISTKSPELVKYIPQSYLDYICNELSDSSSDSFENELKQVIYSHIPEEGRLGTSTFNDLLNKRIAEKNYKINDLKAQLGSTVSGIVSEFEKSDPNFKKELEKQLNDKKESLLGLEKQKPVAITNPLEASEVGSRDFKLGNILKNLNIRKEKIQIDIENTQKELRKLLEVRQVLEGGLSKISTEALKLKAMFSSLVSDLVKLNIEIDEKDAGIKINLKAFERELEKINYRISILREDLDTSKLSSIVYRKQACEKKIEKFSSLVQEKAKAYNDYVGKYQIWEMQRKTIVGDESIFGSIDNLNKRIVEANNAKAQCSVKVQESVIISLEIFAEKMKIIDILMELYSSVQDVASNHPIIKKIKKLKLEFETKLIIKDFEDRFLVFINQNIKGSFYGSEDSAKRVAALIGSLGEPVSQEGVRKFILSMVEAVLYDVREKGKGNELEITGNRQLKKGKKLEDILALIFELEYLDVAYSLKMNDRSISELSPGEKGLLLLIFYTLLDTGDVPLIIDQPEENLDNETIKDVLVPCLRDAKSRRQVIIVTHNPNLAVVCDSEQIIYAEMDKEDGNKITYTAGSIENLKMTNYIVDVLEGTMPAFKNRGAKYDKKARV